jgi:hypothetical protein
MNNTFELLGRWIGLFNPSLLLAWAFVKASFRHAAAAGVHGPGRLSPDALLSCSFAAAMP